MAGMLIYLGVVGFVLYAVARAFKERGRIW